MSANTPPHRVVPPSRRRDKPILSCTLCRRRKLKCDRQQPCKTCIDRGLSISCTYTRNTAIAQDPKAPDSVHDRIDQLEKLVITLMSDKDTGNGSFNPSTPSQVESHSDNSDDAEIPGILDRVKFGEETTSYTNSGHWTSILDGISELREHLDRIPAPTRTDGGIQADTLGPDLLFGRQRHATKQELLAALPVRSDADQLIDTYFASMDTAPMMLHRPTFLREYNDFWAQPFETPTMWLGLLYAILALGARFQATVEGHGPALQADPGASLYSARMDFYREKVVQCLVLANYTKCPPYTIETFMLYFGTEYLRSADTQFSLWVIVGLIIRIAFRMGYHREPSRFPNISPFKAEMRRRIWMVVISLDLISSSSVGLPRMIQPFMYDIEEPRNLVEDDLHEDMIELPPSRPETDLTQLLYSIVLTRVRITHAKVMDLMNATIQPPYRDIMDLDEVLRHVYDRVPESAKAMPAEKFDNTISPASIRRFYLGLSFLKAELMLHRPYLILGRTNTKYEYSRRVCLNAALEILDFQRKLDLEIRPGGALWSPGWQIFTVSWSMSSVVAQDFLLATTVLILDLREDKMHPFPATQEIASSGLRLDCVLPTEEAIVNALRHAHRIWCKASKRSLEARKVASAVRVVLSKAGLSEDVLMSDVNSEHLKRNVRAKTRSSDTLQGTNTGATPSDLTSAPSVDLTDFAPEPLSAGPFSINNQYYANPFAFQDLPSDLGDFADTLNWTNMPAEALMMPPYESMPSRPFYE